MYQEWDEFLDNQYQQTTNNDHESEGPLPHDRESVEYWFRKWGRYCVYDDRYRMTGDSVRRLFEVNGGTGVDLFLEYRNLDSANLEGADLSRANLHGADLSRANLSGASLYFTDLSGAYLIGTNLEGALLSNTNLSGAYLGGLVLLGGYLVMCNLEGADLANADLHESDLYKDNLRGAILTHADLSETNLGMADLSGADLSGANLRGASLWLANLTGAKLWSGVVLSEADLTGADLTGADLSGADLQGTCLRRIRLDGYTNLEGVTWEGNFISKLERIKDYKDAESSYLQLKIWHQNHGDYDKAGEFHYRESECKRKLAEQERKHRRAWQLQSYRLFFGYGERPLRIILAAAAIMLIFIPLYFPNLGNFCSSPSCWETFGVNLIRSFYFSGVSFTALGYGEWVRTIYFGPLKYLGFVESLIGVPLIALFLVTFIKKMMRN